MGRRAAHSDDLERWRTGFRRKLAANFGEDFAAEAMPVVDHEVETFGDSPGDRVLLESIVPARVLVARRVDGAHEGRLR